MKNEPNVRVESKNPAAVYQDLQAEMSIFQKLWQNFQIEIINRKNNFHETIDCLHNIT